MSQNATSAAPFQREDRYIVIKRSDVEKVPVGYWSSLIEPIGALQAHLPHRECLVIESDWPEFEPAWASIEARVTGKPAEHHQGEAINLAAVATLVDDGDGGLEASWLLEGGTAELFAGMTTGTISCTSLLSCIVINRKLCLRATFIRFGFLLQ